ncbi:hypothetical protein BpHYR1_052051 [Brachionus plicatilis]|uniref:Uncharacterized protein n=1 Tax=Brachionus plicatilis TaxID=10195 RepID=A0A3M7RH00_BRAPC|nr:hypothetical protein BpHYR1_052051 [Brachionus plicatilis]
MQQVLHTVFITLDLKPFILLLEIFTINKKKQLIKKQTKREELVLISIKLISIKFQFSHIYLSTGVLVLKTKLRCLDLSKIDI